MKTLIADIDDTLFDWLSMWNGAFRQTLSAVEEVSSFERIEIIAALRGLHVRARTTERGLRGEDAGALGAPCEAISQAGKIFDAISARLTVPFDGVRDTLLELKKRGVTIALHTSSPPPLAAERVVALGLDGLADHVFATACSGFITHRRELRSCRRSNFQVLEYQKPDRAALEVIVKHLGTTPGDCVYIGDSKVHDIPLARSGGALDVHARYGCNRTGENYDLLRDVSHWSDEDIQREKDIQKEEATHSVDAFEEVLQFF